MKSSSLCYLVSAWVLLLKVVSITGQRETVSSLAKTDERCLRTTVRSSYERNVCICAVLDASYRWNLCGDAAKCAFFNHTCINFCPDAAQFRAPGGYCMRQCPATHYLKLLESNWTACVDECPDNHLEISDACIPCAEQCKGCNGLRNFDCLKCRYAWFNSSCVPRCPDGMLPVRVTVVQDPREVLGKSTAGHAATLAPHHVQILTYPKLPDIHDLSRVVLVYPKEGAQDLETFVSSRLSREKDARLTETLPQSEAEDSSGDSGGTSLRTGDVISSGEKCRQDSRLPFDHVVFLDCTWYQAYSMHTDPRLKDLPCVILQPRETRFWRTQKNKPSCHLATIEAIYFFFRELYDLTSSDPYDGRYDDLLFLFSFMHQQIRNGRGDSGREGKEGDVG